MSLLSASAFGLLFCCIDAFNIAVIINGSHVQRIPEGSDVILNCSVSQGDLVADRLDWLKDDKTVTDNVVTMKDSVGLVMSSRLLLKNVYPANTTGEFACRLWNNNASKETYKRRFVRVDDEPQLSISPPYAIMDEGDSRVFTCTVTAGWPLPTLQWLDLSGNVINDKDKVVVVSGKELKFILTNVKLKDKGSYHCRAVNPVGQVKEEVEVIVEELILPKPAKIMPPYKEMYGYRGNNVTLSFKTQHTPLSITHPTWYFGGKKLRKAASSKYFIHKPKFHTWTEGTFSITVHNLTEEDSGNYTLNVKTSTRPSAFGHIYLRVTKRVPYEIHAAKTQVQVTMSAVKVNCEAKYPSNGEQIPKLYWSLNGTQLIPQSKYKTHLLEQDKGHYTLITISLTIYNFSKSDCLWYTCGMNTSQGTMERLVAPPCPMNKTETEDENQRTSRPVLVWIPITLGSISVIIVGTGVAFLLSRRHKSKNGHSHGMTKGLMIMTQSRFFKW